MQNFTSNIIRKLIKKITEFLKLDNSLGRYMNLFIGFEEQ